MSPAQAMNMTEHSIKKLTIPTESDPFDTFDKTTKSLHCLSQQ